ncbi:filamentous hemagglutinin outer membrane protein [Anabaenopsis circularis NIES-21]|uniref:Filamentous hemagglutinin outer membrane protein n=1 Tax=Anabaenopsis circularis NIES-21 TaxID=1085406 RepID=A0A1Z4GJG7_9CYAN|nr:filamentous hemagglutinin outer membrane protein [Anabaenopsis circularis NIES-21]
MREKTIKITQSYYLSKLKLILALSSAIITTSANNVLAQNITIDGTLSPAQTLNGPTYTIPQSVGQTVNSNLFHSFGQFSLNQGERANFQSNANIRNIFSRVTGGYPSNIDGLIFTQNRSVNLYLINPSGIVFGPNARLNVGGSTRGSFVATTADALVWSNGSQFSATNPGGTSSLLTIVGDPSGFLFNHRPPQPIQVFGSQLSVYQGQSLLLLGGDVSLDNGQLSVDFTEGGRIELGAVAEPGTVGLTTNGNILSLSFPENLAQADVLLTQESFLDVTAGNGGSIAINARNIDILGGSQLRGGIGSELGNVDSQAGDVTLNATDAITFDRGDAFSNVEEGAVGNGGNIRITADSLSVTNGAQLITSSAGQGNAGNVIIDAQQVLFDGTDTEGFSSSAFSDVVEGAVGNGGEIRITANSLSVTNGAQLFASSAGQGNAGNVIIDAQKVLFDSTDGEGSRSSAYSDVEKTAVGNGGEIRITANSLSVTNGAQLFASSAGQGNAGNVIIDAEQVLFDGTDAEGFNSSAYSDVEEGAVGNGGEIRITANSLSVTNGAQLFASSAGQGNAGNVIIDAEQVLFDGTDAEGSRSSAYSDVLEGAVGNGGEIRITTNSLSVTNGARLFASSAGQGNAGNVIIDAQQVLFDGRITNGNFPSGAFSLVGQTAVGNGGDVRITANSLALTNGAQINAFTRGQGNAGNVIIDAQLILFDGTDSATFSTVEQTAVGSGGDIRISTNSLSVTNGAQLIASTRGQGNAGNIQITTFDKISVSGTSSINGRSSALFTNSNSTGKGGDITINAPLFLLSDNAVLDARTRNDGNGGNITVNANIVEVINGGQILSTTAGRGSAGKITVNATERAIINGRDASFDERVARFGTRVANVDAASGLFVRSDSLGSAGDIEVNSPFVLLDNGGRFIAESRSVNGGDISVNAGNALLLRRGSQISTTAGTAQAGGNGGNININAGFVIALPNENSNITANAFSGTGGQVQINTQGIFGIEPRLNDSINSSDITASSTTGINGEIIITTPNVDPTQGLTNLPADTVNTASLIDSACSASDDKTGSQFTVTGRGGLPPSPDEVLNGDAVWSDTRLTVAAKPHNGSVSRVTTPQKSSNAISIVPATGWVFNNKGEVTLVSQVAQVDAYNVGSNHVACGKP